MDKTNDVLEVTAESTSCHNCFTVQ